MMSEPHNVDPLKPQPDAITVNRQRLAANPRQSAWVSANAGSGKTYVLSTRVIRLLLDNVEPSKILCLTYTKTAAAEMKNRVFSRLGEWVTMDDAQLSKTIADIVDRRVSEAEIAFARTLFAKALETPGGLKIQTIHAFCEALLHRFPLEANIAGHFELIDDKASRLLVSEARRQLLTGQSQEAHGAVQRILADRGETGLQALLDEIISTRQKVNDTIKAVGDTDAERRETYLTAFGFDSDVTSESIKAETWPQLSMQLEYMRSVRDEASAAGKARAYEFAYGYVVALEKWQTPEGFDLLASVILKSDGSAYSPTWLFAKDILNTFPALADMYLHDAELLGSITNRLSLLTEIEQTLDALTIADKFLSLYAGLKNARGLLDFEDLIARTENMLMKDNISAWVRYKLDQGIDHILVDEAQDTSPIQWRVIKILADEFFDGEGARDIDRSVFAVGDEKQSIYSFQGADPAEFANARDHFSQKLRQVEKPFQPLELEASFRSTGDVLAAVDHVFSFADHKKGVAPRQLEAQKHRSLRVDQPGYVEVWDLEKAVPNDDEEDWTKPVDHAAKPAIIVARRIAKRIYEWLNIGERFEANGKKVRAGDILVLVRKRDAFVHALSKALKEYDIPVAGADRLQMTQHIAILDLMALGRILLNQHDDLSLAALLRSPIFGWSETQLFDLAQGRGSQPLYDCLRQGLADPHTAAVFEQLERWRTKALNLPVFEFFSHVLTVDKVRAKLIGRLGPETADMLDEFLSYAIAQERTSPISLETFIHTLDNFGPEIKREMDGDRNEVRIMTVHGAKGLEAPIVFLVDPGSAAFSARNAPILLPLDLPNGLNEPIKAVLAGGSGGNKSEVTTAIVDTIKEQAVEEYNRLLYVGMTRAADRLIVAGYAGVNGGGPDTWREMVERSLLAHSAPIDYGNYSAIRFPADQKLATHKPRDDEQSTVNDFLVPDCFGTPAPSEPPAARPLVPSGASGLAIEPDRQDSDGEVPASLLAQFQSGGQNNEMSAGLAAKRGTLIHKLLQMLPEVDKAEQRQRAQDYCRLSDHRWSQSDIDAILTQVFNVLDNDIYAPFFMPGAMAEVSVMGTIDISGETRAVSGVIDRLSVSDTEVHLIDYKTNAHPPHTLYDVPEVYLRQMALYHALVAPLYPGKTVRAALLFTATPQLIEVDQPTLTAALNSIAPLA